MISFMVTTKPDWSGLVLSTQNLSCNSEFVHLPSWYKPHVCYFALFHVPVMCFPTLSCDPAIPLMFGISPHVAIVSGRVLSF